MNTREWKKKRYAISREKIKELEEKIRNADKYMMESHRSEQRLNDVKKKSKAWN